MPELKTRRLFISHAWSYSVHYHQVVNWFNEEPNFTWSNYSVPKHDSCSEKTSAGLTRCMNNQLKPSQCIIILAGMYAAHSAWIEYEINEAVRMGKTIIGVRPWKQERVPQIIQDNADVMVGWNKASIISAVRYWA